MTGFKVEGRHINLREEGAGPPVVLLHCSSSHSGQWKPWFSKLSAKARVLAPDFHGYGRSAPLPEGAIWWQADRLLVPELSKRVGQKVHVVGHSLGGAAAVYSAVSHPESVASLTVIEPVLFGLMGELGWPEFADAQKISERLFELLNQGRDDEAAMAFTDFWSGDGAFGHLSPHQQTYIIETIHRVGDDWRGLRAGLEGQLTVSDIETLDCPVHLIKGAQPPLGTTDR